MPFFAASTRTSGGRRLSLGSLVTALAVCLWLAVACGFPLRQVAAARRHAHRELVRLLAADSPDRAGVIAAFDQGNQDLGLAASVPCSVMAVAVLFLAHRAVRSGQRCAALERRLQTCQPHPGSAGHWRN